MNRRRRNVMVWFRLCLASSAFLGAIAFGVAERAHAQTSPKEFLGYQPGDDFHLTNYEQARGYFEKLASETPRMRLMDMGPTSGGRRMIYAVISSEENLSKLEHYRKICQRLSLAKGVSQEEAEQLADEGKAIVWIDGSLHATEVAPSEVNLRLAYEMVTKEDRQTKFIRENVILLLVYANPDGMTIVSDWYMQNLGTPYEVSPTPELYHKYAGHDNNRDSFIANLVETRNMNHATSRVWFPHILYNQHQTAPFPARIWIPPESEPTNPNVHPLVVRWKNLIGSAMGKSFEEAKQDGAISRITFDSWFPGYVTQIVDSHNIPSILTETALYRYATPRFYPLSDFSQAHRDLTVGTFYPTPWKGGWWRIGDAVEYNLTACRSILEVAAKYRHEFLYNKWKMATEVMDRFKSAPPYGWIFPADQRDPNTTALLMNRMMILGMEVYQADEAFTHLGIRYPQGSLIVPTSQPFGYFVKNMFEKQVYPDLRKHPHLWQGIVGTARLSDAPLRPYDGVGWTLPIQMGVQYQEMGKDFNVKMTPVSEPLAPQGGVTGNGSHFLFSHTDNNAFLAVNRIVQAGGTVEMALEPFKLGGKKHPAGTFLVPGASLELDKLKQIAQQAHVSLTGGNVKVRSKTLRKPRIGMYKSWVTSMDAGWITLVLEQYGFDFRFLTNSEVKAGKLKNRFDVIILSSQSPSAIINGHRKGTMPPDYVGGITPDGVEHLKQFVKDGGILISNQRSNDLAIRSFRLPLKNALRGVSSDKFSIPGSIIKMRYDTTHPLAFGMQSDGVAHFSGGRAYEVVKPKKKSTKASDGKANAQGESANQDNEATEGPGDVDLSLSPVVVARYPNEPLLISGWQVGQEHLYGKAAVIDVPVGNGHVVLFGFNVINRAQTYATFKLLFNAIYH